MSIERIRLEFIREDENVDNVLDLFINYLKGEETDANDIPGSTRGHFKRGVL